MRIEPLVSFRKKRTNLSSVFLLRDLCRTPIGLLPDLIPRFPLPIISSPGEPNALRPSPSVTVDSPP